MWFNQAKLTERFRAFTARIRDLISTNIFFYLVLLLGVSLFILPTAFTAYRVDPGNMKENLIANAATFLLDITFFGLLFAIFDALRNKKISIERYLEEIEDYRDLDEKQAAFRLAGIVRRLNKLNVHEIDLYGCNLSETNLINADFRGSSMFGANLWGIHCPNSDFRDTDLIGANLAAGDFFGSSFCGSKVGKGFGRAKDDTNFRNADLSACDLRKVQGLTVDHVCSAESILGAEMDEDLKNQAMLVCPEKFIYPPDLLEVIAEIETPTPQ